MNNNDFFGQNPFHQNPFEQGPNDFHEVPKPNFREMFDAWKRTSSGTQKKAKPSRIVWTILLFLAQLFAQFYVMLPAINIQSMEFWMFAGENIIILMVLSTVLCGGSFAAKLRKIGIPVLLAGVVVFFAVSLLSSPILQSRQYADLMKDSITKKEISEYTPTIDNVPLLDKDSATRLAGRTLGNLINEVSQFELYDSYQITVNGAPVRTQPLDYVGAVKWFLNRKTGIPAYITVDMKTQDSDIVRLDEGIKYSHRAYLNDNIDRHVRFHYPTAILGESRFELDESGHPYWVYPVLEHTIMLFSGTDVKGVITVDPVTGACANYAKGDIPDWIDNVYSAELVMQQYDWYGSYQNGWLNSVIGQKGVVRTTKGYNYIPKDNDLYMYTGVTSVLSDESNIGFIFTNLRTRETEFYEIAGAEEYSAMESAQGVVQHLHYTSTFPILLMIEGHPTYTVALKDDAGLVKQYGMVNMAQYQLVATGSTIKECQANYRKLLQNNGTEVTQTETTELAGTIADIRTAVINGTTYYYVQLSDGGAYYILSAADNENAVLLDVGDNVTLNIDTEDKDKDLQKAGLKGATASEAAVKDEEEQAVPETTVPPAEEE